MGTGVLLAADRVPVIFARAFYSNKWPFRGPFTIKRGLVGGCSWDFSPFCSSHLLHCFFHHLFHRLLLFHLHRLSSSSSLSSLFLPVFSLSSSLSSLSLPPCFLSSSLSSLFLPVFSLSSSLSSLSSSL